jgi:hypothetical protein
VHCKKFSTELSLFTQSISGQKHAKDFLFGSSAKRTVECLKLSRFQARQMTGLLTGHCHVRGHFFKLGKVIATLVGGASKKQKWPCISYVIVMPWLDYDFITLAGIS